MTELPMSLTEIEAREAGLVDELFRLGPATAYDKRKLVRKRAGIEAALDAVKARKTVYLQSHPEVLRKNVSERPVVAASVSPATPVPPTPDVPQQALESITPDEAERRLTMAMRTLPATPETFDVHEKLRQTQAALRAARARHDGKVTKMMSKTSPAPSRRSPLIDEQAVTEMILAARDRQSEEKRLTAARNLLKAHPAGWGHAGDCVATIARDQVSAEPPWVAFRRSLLPETSHPAFKGRL
jgi:hypothetical protein